MGNPNQEKLTQARFISGNPYAYLDGDGDFSIIQKSPLKLLPAKVKGIEKDVRKLQLDLWNNRKNIWRGLDVPKNPIDVLDVQKAFEYLGYSYLIFKASEQLDNEDYYTDVGAIIENGKKQVWISGDYSTNVQNFTAAHELGHAIRHKHVLTALHRDKPLQGQSRRDTVIELEADKFAVFFLMPTKQVLNYFSIIFGLNKLDINHDILYTLDSSGKYLNLLNSDRRSFSRVIASAEHFNGRRFTSLSDRFKVSVESMAIRLEELGLV